MTYPSQTTTRQIAEAMEDRRDDDEIVTYENWLASDPIGWVIYVEDDDATT